MCVAAPAFAWGTVSVGSCGGLAGGVPGSRVGPAVGEHAPEDDCETEGFRGAGVE